MAVPVISFKAIRAERFERAMQRLGARMYPAVKAELDVQIAALQKVNDDAEAFVKANEEKFSIFGWLVKLFSN